MHYLSLPIQVYTFDAAYWAYTGVVVSASALPSQRNYHTPHNGEHYHRWHRERTRFWSSKSWNKVTPREIRELLLPPLLHPWRQGVPVNDSRRNRCLPRNLSHRRRTMVSSKLDQSSIRHPGDWNSLRQVIAVCPDRVRQIVDVVGRHSRSGNRVERIQVSKRNLGDARPGLPDPWNSSLWSNNRVRSTSVAKVGTTPMRFTTYRRRTLMKATFQGVFAPRRFGA